MSEKVADLLFELGTEELPAKAVEQFSKNFTQAFKEALFSEKITYSQIKTAATPRRIGVVITDVATQQPDLLIEKKGPSIAQAFTKEGNLTAMGEGFARSCGLNLEEMRALRDEQTDRIVFRMTQEGAKTRDLLPNLIAASLKKALFGRTMYWGVRNEAFIRPVHWAVLLFGKEVIPGKIFGKEFGNETQGHRFLAPQKIQITSPLEYEKQLLDTGFVVADFDARKQIIANELNRVADTLQAKPLMSNGLLNEVTGLVEWPVVLLGKFDESFLAVPQEVLITSMQENQKCFGLVDDHGKLLPAFIMVSNLISQDPARVIAGNEKVMRARLEDAKFFFEVDRKMPLIARSEKLKNILFQAELGSIYDKTQRIKAIALLLAKTLELSEEDVARAADLSKCDLATEMVGEFPELQGVMGKYYAWHDNESLEVSLAIEEQYLPRFANDKLPETPLGQVMAIADRIDTLLALFAIGKHPSGDKDPFALRRAALGIVRICVEQRLSFNLFELLEKSFLLFEPEKIAQPETVDNVWQFILERQRAWYSDKGITNEIFNAVAVIGCRNLAEFDQRVLAVKEFVALPEAKALAAANKRVMNLLQKQPEVISGEAPQVTLLQEPNEITLAKCLQDKALEIAPLCEKNDFTQSLMVLAQLQKPIDDFFDTVMVMVDDASIRNNRVRLLQQARELFLKIADISLLTDERK